MPGYRDASAGMAQALSGLQASIGQNTARQDRLKELALENERRALEAKDTAAYRTLESTNTAAYRTLEATNTAAYRSDEAANTAAYREAQSKETEARTAIAQAEEKRRVDAYNLSEATRKAQESAALTAANGGLAITDRTPGVEITTEADKTKYIEDTIAMQKDASSKIGMDYTPDQAYIDRDNNDASKYNALQERLKDIGPTSDADLKTNYDSTVNTVTKQFDNGEITETERKNLIEKASTDLEDGTVALHGEERGGILEGTSRLLPSLGLGSRYVDHLEEGRRAALADTKVKADEKQLILDEQAAIQKRITDRTTPLWDKRQEKVAESDKTIEKNRLDGISHYKSAEELQQSITTASQQYIKDNPQATTAEVLAAHAQIKAQAKPYIDNLAKVTAAKAEINTFKTKEAIKQEMQSKADKLSEIYKATYNPNTDKPEKSSFNVDNLKKMEDIISKQDSDGNQYYTNASIGRAKKWIRAYEEQQ